jgi:hypothetical protein
MLFSPPIFPGLTLALALGICASADIARAENASVGSGLQTTGLTGPREDDRAPPEHEEDGSRRVDHVRIGVLGGVGFPRPLAIEGLVKVERLVVLGLEYSALPTMTISGAQVSFWAAAADVRFFPGRGNFFIGLRAGRQHLGGKGVLTVDPYGSVLESVSIATTFLNPRIGFLWTWEPGVTLGIDLGVQLPIAKKIESTLPSGYPATDEVMRVAHAFGGTALPTVDLIRLGVLL